MKGIAVTTLVLLIIGMVVIAIVGYLLYRTFMGQTFSKEDCKSQLTAACSNCVNFGVCQNPPCIDGFKLADFGLAGMNAANCSKWLGG